MGELRYPCVFSYETEELAEAFLMMLPLGVLVERVLIQKTVVTGRRLLHTHDLRWGAISFTTEFTKCRTTFRIRMTIFWGSNTVSQRMGL